MRAISHDDRSPVFIAWTSSGVVGAIINRIARERSLQLPKAEFEKRTNRCEQTEKLLDGLRVHFRRLCAAQRRAGDENSRLANRKRSIMAALFVLTLLAAMLMHLFAHWHPQEGHGHNGVRSWLAITALTFVTLGLWTFWRHGGKRTEEKAHDYRALAEGVRVQARFQGDSKFLPSNPDGIGRFVITRP